MHEVQVEKRDFDNSTDPPLLVNRSEVTVAYEAEEAGRWDGPVRWAAHYVTHGTEARRSPDGVRIESTYAEPYGTRETVTTVRLSGDWTDAERADVLARVAGMA